jgi:hypothetical protein
MTGLYAVEVEPEVRSWLEQLSDRDFGRVDFLVGVLAEHAAELGEPGRFRRRRHARPGTVPHTRRSIESLTEMRTMT